MVQWDVTKLVQELFGARSILKEVNATFLVLIMKVVGEDSMNQFRPISSCNSFYKIISKVLASRIIKVFPSIIAPRQSGFVPG